MAPAWLPDKTQTRALFHCSIALAATWLPAVREPRTPWGKTLARPWHTRLIAIFCGGAANHKSKRSFATTPEIRREKKRAGNGGGNARNSTATTILAQPPVKQTSAVAFSFFTLGPRDNLGGHFGLKACDCRLTPFFASSKVPFLGYGAKWEYFLAS